MVAAVVRAVASKKRFVRVPASLVPAAGDMRLSSKVTAKGEAGVKKKKALLPKKKRSAAGASGTKKKASPRSVRTKKAVPKKKAPKSAVKKLKKPTIVREPPQQPPPHHRPVMQVYVLELEGGHVYVGKSSDVKLRVGQHMAGAGSAFTKAHRPTGRLLPRLGTLVGDGDGPERDETLRQMLRHGARRVRGWRYCSSKDHSPADLRDIETNIRELLDLCRRCGRPGHFASGCRLATDRLGAVIHN